MKKVLIVFALLACILSNAQEKPEGRRNQRENPLTKDQRQELLVKKMTLDLDLSASQQKELRVALSKQRSNIEKVMAERKASKGETTKKLNAEDRFAMKSRMLDEQIAMKASMKKILSNEQFKKWETMKESKNDRIQQRIAMHKQRKSNRPTTNK